MKKVILVVLLFNFSFLNVFGQKQLLPKGNWVVSDLLDASKLGLGMEMKIFADTLIFDIIDTDKNKVVEQQVFKIMKVKADPKKGKMLLRLVGKEKYSIGFFYKLKGVEDIIIAPAKAEIVDQAEAMRNFMNAEKWTIQKINAQRKSNGKKAVKNIDPYRLGMIFRTKSRIDSLNKLPDIPNDKKTYITILDALIKAFRDKNNQAFYNQPMTAFYLLGRVYEQQGFNPLTSFIKMTDGLKQYEYDTDIQDKSVDFALFVAARLNW